MKKEAMWLILVLFYFCLVASAINRKDEETMNIVFNLFTSKEISAVTFLTCWDKDKKTSAMKKLSLNGIMISFSFDSISQLPVARTGAVLDLSCGKPAVQEFIEALSRGKMFGVHTEWLLLDYTQNATKTVDKTEGVELLDNAYILPGSCVTLAQISDDSVSYFDTYRIVMHFPLKFLYLGSSTSDEDDFPDVSQRKPRLNFEGALFRTASIVMHPEVFKGLEDHSTPDIDTWPKIHYPLIKNIAEQLNFKFSITFLDNYGWKVNGTFNGLMGLFQKEDIEFAATAFFFREDRMDVIDFTAETYALRSMIIFKQPALSTVSNIFILPFTKMVWIACGALCVLVIILLVAERFILHLIRSSPYTTKVSFFDIITLVLGLVCQQGTHLAPISVSARITIFMFSLAAIFFYTSYSANIVALLQSKSPTIKSLVDLTKSPLSLKMEDLEYIRVYLKEASDPNIINLYNKKIKPFGLKVYCHPREGVKQLRTGKVAFNVDVNLGYKIISETFEEHEKCGLSELAMFFIPKLSFPVIKKSGYREIFTQRIAWQRELGIMNRITNIWLPQKPRCEGKGGGYISVGLTEFLPALLALIYGILVSFGVFIAEIMYSNRAMCEERSLEPSHEDNFTVNFNTKNIRSRTNLGHRTFTL